MAQQTVGLFSISLYIHLFPAPSSHLNFSRPIAQYGNNLCTMACENDDRYVSLFSFEGGDLELLVNFKDHEIVGKVVAKAMALASPVKCFNPFSLNFGTDDI